MARSSISTKLLPWLGLLLAVLLSACAWLLYVGRPASTGGSDLGRLIATAHSARDRAREVLAGEIASFAAFETRRSDLAVVWQSVSGDLAVGDATDSMAINSAEVETLLDGLEAFAMTREALSAVADSSNRIQTLAPELLASTRALLNAQPLEDREANQVFLEWLDQSVNGMLAILDSRSADGPIADTVETLVADSSYATEIVRGVVGGSSGLGVRSAASFAQPAELETTTRLVNEIGLAVDAIGERQEALVAAEQAFQIIDARVSALGEQLQSSPPSAAAAGIPYLPLGLLGMSLIVLAVLMFAFLRARQLSRTADVHAQQNESNQEAILRLLDELSSLADGDLTVQATVTEDITGAIADSINYAIEALRELVITIRDSSLMLDGAAKQSEATAHQLVRASETQAKQAVAASNSITQMAASVAEVSNNAERCSDVARHAVEVSHKGGDAVRRTIEGMNTIRETIQDTSKRIKRLGESSQEIGNIVELIEEIAEQTNILALNASIEASRAGEASRGFAVVADEVQKLAERSTAATRKIEVLVSTIQSDTNEAIVSMERSTTDVVGGALLAENAGAALDEIEKVSHQIANLLQNISGSAREQTGVAKAISRNMDVLKEVSAKSKQSTTAASSSISKLSELASQLRETVSGFALPDDDIHAGGLSNAQIAESFIETQTIAAEQRPPKLGTDQAVTAASEYANSQGKQQKNAV